MASTYSSYIGGEWTKLANEFEVVDPATAQPFASVGTVDVEQVKQALVCAEAAWPAWRALTVKDRGALLHKVADELLRRKAEIARAITLENGKPLAQSEGEVMMSEDHLRWFAEEAKRAYGRTIPNHAPGKRHMVFRTSIGVVGAIAPWNFPLALAVRKIAPAMAAGCPVILKPATQTPLSAILLAECMQAAGVPAGVFQVVIGDAVMISGEFLANPICRKISFTGSTRVGRALIRGAADSDQAAVPGAWRPRARTGLRRLRHGARRRADDHGQVPQHRAVLHRGQPHLRAARRLQGVHGRALQPLWAG